MQKIVFFFPWKAVSPNAIYLCQLADSLAEDRNFEVHYVDYLHGASAQLLTNYRVRRYPYVNKTAIFPEEPVILVMPIDRAMTMPQLHPDSRVLFVNWNRESVPALQRNWKTEESNITTFLKLVHQHDGVFFTDKTDWMAQNQQTELQHAENFVPYTVNYQDPISLPGLISRDEYHVAIWANLYADTVYPVIELLNSLADLALGDRKVNVHIIGTGPKEKLLFDRMFPECINLIKHEPMTEEETLALLAEQADIVFAQRTQALSAGLLGLPTVIMPESWQYFRCNQYVFLHQADGYALRWTPEEMVELNLPALSIAEVLEKVYAQDQKEILGSACRDYVLQNHTENCSALKQALEQCGLQYKMLQALICSTSAEQALEKASGGRVKTLLKKIIGTRVRRYCLLGVPLFTLRQAYDDQFNLFMLGFIPFLRIRIQEKHYSATLLLFSWIKTVVKKLFVKLFGKNRKAFGSSMRQNRLRRKLLKKLNRGEKIRVCLFVSRISCWTFERLYEILENSPYFEPTVVVKPFMHQGHAAMVNYMEETYSALKTKGYRILKGYDAQTDQFLDLRGTLNPDVLFYTKYWLPQFHPNFYISKFRDKITFYTSYCFDIAYHPAVMNFELNNTVDRYFMASQIHKRMAEQYMDNGGRNVHVTGAPKLDMLLDPNYCPKSVWKPQPSPKKRIIWAPHHSDAFPGDLYQFNAFFELHQFMLDIAEKYKDSIQIAFKPHPMLKPKLDEKWGRRKADAYYKQWADLENGQLETGEFIDLFKTSDAMIMDSISFIAEYTAVNKPALFTIGRQTRVKLNEFGMINFDVLYKTENSLFDDIVRFVKDVVIGGNDIKREEREAFIQQYLAAPGGKDAAQVIYENMCDEILNGERLEK